VPRAFGSSCFGNPFKPIESIFDPVSCLLLSHPNGSKAEDFSDRISGFVIDPDVGPDGILSIFEANRMSPEAVWQGFLEKLDSANRFREKEKVLGRCTAPQGLHAPGNLKAGVQQSRVQLVVIAGVGHRFRNSYFAECLLSASVNRFNQAEFGPELIADGLELRVKLLMPDPASEAVANGSRVERFFGKRGD
jgi:hypothetical protein